MINKKKVQDAKKRAVTFLLISAMLIAQTQPVEAARSVTEVEKDKQNINKEIEALDSELAAILSSMASLELEIEQKQQEIAEAEIALQQAQEAVDNQYEAMKLRIQFMYENSDQSVLSILLESGSISDFLNRLEYVSSVNTYDRELLDSYEAIKQEVEDMKLGLEQEKKNLVASQEMLQQQQSELNALLASKKSDLSNIEAELAEAKEEARRQEEERRRQEQATNNNSGANGGGSTSTGTTENLNPPNTTAVSGSAVVSYANQFVGNPYVWGGNSLTSGCDCSGFVHLVYKNFGISLPRYSGAFASVGKEVSYNNMQPGDIIVYQPKAGIGHVAIYAGGGTIVEAQSSSAGITNNRAANCRAIWTIRRVL